VHETLGKTLIHQNSFIGEHSCWLTVLDDFFQLYRRFTMHKPGSDCAVTQNRFVCAGHVLDRQVMHKCIYSERTGRCATEQTITVVRNYIFKWVS